MKRKQVIYKVPAGVTEVMLPVMTGHGIMNVRVLPNTPYIYHDMIRGYCYCITVEQVEEMTGERIEHERG